MTKAKGILQSQKGESLLESIISIVVFSVLVAAVTMILTTAMRWTSQSFDEAYSRQSAANAAAGLPASATAGVTVVPGNAQVSFRIYTRGEFGYEHAGTLPQGVTVRNANGITAFEPLAPPPPVGEPE